MTRTGLGHAAALLPRRPEAGLPGHELGPATRPTATRSWSATWPPARGASSPCVPTPTPTRRPLPGGAVPGPPTAGAVLHRRPPRPALPVRRRRADRQGLGSWSSRATIGSPQPLPDGRVLYCRTRCTGPNELYVVEPATARSAAGHADQRRQARRRSHGRAGAVQLHRRQGRHGVRLRRLPGRLRRGARSTRSRSSSTAGRRARFGNDFHYRWNPQAYAGAGYAAVMVDFHGSTGYGQAFTDAINGDWGGAPFEDLMKGLDSALQKYPFLDGNAGRRAGRLVRRLHDQLDRRPDRPLQGAGLPRRQPRRAHGLLRHRGAVVPRVGARRHAVGQPGRATPSTTRSTS